MKRILFFLLLSVTLVACSSSSETSTSAQGQPAEEAVNEEQASKEGEGLQKKKQGMYADPIIKEEDFSLTPKRIQIPAIGVDASIENVGTLANGQMGVPQDEQNVAWFEPGAKPGAKGSSVLAGHVGRTEGAAVFYHLQNLKQGDEVVVTGESGDSLTFVVTGREVFPQNNAPVEDIFGYTARKSLKLITCTGEYIRNSGGHQDRLVVFTELKEA